MTIERILPFRFEKEEKITSRRLDHTIVFKMYLNEWMDPGLRTWNNGVLSFLTHTLWMACVTDRCDSGPACKQSTGGCSAYLSALESSLVDGTCKDWNRNHRRQGAFSQCIDCVPKRGKLFGCLVDAKPSIDIPSSRFVESFTVTIDAAQE